MSPHSLHRDADGNLWVTPLFNSVVALRDLKSGQWKTWRLRTPDGKSPGIHDLSFGHAHELLTDTRTSATTPSATSIRRMAPRASGRPRRRRAARARPLFTACR
jgi:hypothetical protein